MFYGDPPHLKRLGTQKRDQPRRILAPIDAAWQEVEHGPVARTVITRALIHDVALSGVAYWGWERDTWLNIIRSCTRRPHRAIAFALAHRLGGVAVPDAAEARMHPHTWRAECSAPRLSLARSSACRTSRSVLATGARRATLCPARSLAS